MSHGPSTANTITVYSHVIHKNQENVKVGQSVIHNIGKGGVFGQEAVSSNHLCGGRHRECVKI